MRSLVRPLALFGFVIAASAGITAQTPKLLYPPGDPATEIASALAAAKKDGKHVLIDFGADWCPDCRVLAALFETDIVAPVAERNFHVVHVDVGRRDKNLDLVAKYNATAGDWIPAVVVLDADGSTVALTNDEVRLTRRTTPEQLRDLLRQWAPTQKVQDLATFTERGVRVQLTLERDWAGRLWLAGAFTPLDAKTHLYAQELPAGGVDGVGRPTRLGVVGGTLKAIGPAVANRPVQADRIELLKQTYPIYPAGAVTLRVPVARVKGDTSSRSEVSITYMGCGPKGCLPPVVDKRVFVELVRSGASSPLQSRQPMTPDAALQALFDGNSRFAQNRLTSLEGDLFILRERTVDNQQPFAGVLSCADSRVPVELVFDQTIGQIFVTRIAGNIVTPEIIASLEYGVAILGVKALLVLGHTSCGAVNAAIGGADVPGKIGLLYDHLGPAVARSGGDARQAVALNARLQAERLAAESAVISEAIRRGILRLTSGVYDLATGRVSFDQWQPL